MARVRDTFSEPVGALHVILYIEHRWNMFLLGQDVTGVIPE